MSRQSRKRNELKTFWLVSSLAIILLLAAAVLQINGYIHQNSLASDLQKQIVSISSENDALEAKLSQTNSLDNFNQYAVAQEGNYEKVDVASIHYVHSIDEQLAKR